MSYSLMSCPSMWPKQFWSDQIDMDLTIMIWLWPKWIGHNQNDLVGSKLVLLIYHSSNLDPTNSFWSWPNHYGQMQINLVRPKPFWTNQSCVGHIGRQGIRMFMPSNVFRIKMLYHPFFIEDADQLLVHLQAAVKEKLVDFSQKIVSWL